MGRPTPGIAEGRSVPLPETAEWYFDSRRVAVAGETVDTLALSTHPDITVTDGAHWLPNILLDGPNALLHAAVDLLSHYDLTTLNVSTLNYIGARVSAELRRVILLRELEATGWNLTHTADRLRMSGSANVLRAIKELGLTYAYEDAKRKGIIKTGGRRKRVVKAKPITEE
jgi:hypothetical protein